MMWKNGIVLVENVTQTIVQLKNDKGSKENYDDIKIVQLSMRSPLLSSHLYLFKGHPFLSCHRKFHMN
jgi:hypothetical protein